MAVYKEAVLAVVFVISVLTTPSYSQDACTGEVVKCAGQLIFYTTIGIQNIQTTFTACGKYQELADCLDAIKEDNCQSQTTLMKNIVKDVLVDSPVCAKKDEAEKYSKCWTNSKLVDPQLCKQGASDNPEVTCKNLLTTVNCYAENTKMECGQEQSDLVDLVLKVVSKNIGKMMGKDCPEPEVSSSTVNTRTTVSSSTANIAGTTVSSSTVNIAGSSLLMSLLMICVGVVAFN